MAKNKETKDEPVPTKVEDPVPVKELLGKDWETTGGTTAEPVPVAEVAVEVSAESIPEPVPAPPEPALPVTFDRWFGTLGKPLHHKHGMRAYVNTAGKKTIAQWTAIFAKY